MKKYILFLIIFCIFFVPLTITAAPEPELIEGMDFYYQKNWESAKYLFGQAAEKNPRDTLALSFYYSCHLWTDSMPLAVIETEDYYVQNPDDINALGKLAFAYYAMSQVDITMQVEAKSEFRDILTMEPDNSVAHTGMGMLYNDKRMTPRAKAEFISALQANPEDIMALELLGVIVMIDDADPAGSMGYFKKITDLVPNYPDGHFYMASAHYKLGEYEEALPYLIKTIELDPLGIGKGYFAPLFLGDVYMELDRYEEAVAAYEKALLLNETSLAAQTKLEKAREAMGQKKD